MPRITISEIVFRWCAFLKNIYCIVGPSGCGKTTLVEALQEKYGYNVVESYTTRAPRYPGETGHIFVSPEEFNALGEMYAYTRFDGYEYGVTVDLLEKNDLYVIEPSGVKFLRENYHGDKGISVIGLTAPTEVLRARMKERGDSVEKIQDRLAHDYDAFRDVHNIVDVHIDTSGSIEPVCQFVREWIIFHERKAEREAQLTTNPGWLQMQAKYPEPREEMDHERERQFVNDCFVLYEQEGFSDKFWSPYGDYKERFGQPFTVVERCTEESCQLEALPMWNIRFGDGAVIGAYAEEIVPSEMKENGCPYFNEVDLIQKVADASRRSDETVVCADEIASEPELV